MIRVLTEKDVDIFVEIRMYSLKESPTAFGASFEEGIDHDLTYQRLSKHNEEYFTLGYFEKDKLAGIIGFIRKERSKQRHIADIWGMYVRPECRGKGIGKAMLSECLNRAKNIRGLAKVNLSVTHLQGNARKLYEQLGFVTWGVEKDARRMGDISIDEVFMSWHC